MIAESFDATFAARQAAAQAATYGTDRSEPDRIAAAVAEAQRLATWGCGIVEVHPPVGDGRDSDGKRPVGDDWQKRATRSPHTIAEIVGKHGQYGAIPWPDEGVLILDVDRREQLQVSLPAGYRVTRGRDRGHAYYRLPDRFDAGRLPATMPWGEVRVAGASRHVVGPYSRHMTGDVYLPHGSALTEIPVYVLEQLFPKRESFITVGGAGYELPQAGYLGSRYGEILRYTASLHHFRRSADEAWLLVSGLLAPRFAEALTEAELRSRFERAWNGKMSSRLGAQAAGPQPPNVLRFYSPLELAAMTLPTPDWIVRPGYVAIASITEVDGKIKAAGKTTLILWMVRSVLDGLPFLGEPTRQARVLYVTEQSRQTFMDGLRLAGLAGRGDELRILFREDFHGAPWPEIVGAAKQDGYDVVVFDTIGKLAGIREENSAGEWAGAMSPLQDLAASGRAVIIARHDRKGGGEVGDSGRGSSQASGDVDIILAIRRPEGNQPSTRRVIESLSRYRETPEKIVVELGPDGYSFLGTEDAVASVAAEGFVSSAIGSEYRTNGIGPDLKELAEAGEREEPPVRRTQISQALAALTARGEIERSGAGRRGDPYRYTPAAGGEIADSFRTQTVGTGRMNETVDEGYGPSAYLVDPEAAA